jgi:protease I
MNFSLTGKNIALLVANGFDETQVTEIQRALTKLKANLKIIAPEQGVVNGWQGDGWGHHFPVNVPINDALGSDFDILVLPGGEHAIAKLKTNLHTRRIINHFMDSKKLIAAIGAGVSLLALSPRISARTVSVPEAWLADLIPAGAQISKDPQCIDGHILSADGSDTLAWVAEALRFFDNSEVMQEAA